MAITKNISELPQIIYIPTEDGLEEEFEVIMEFEVDGTNNKYMLVVALFSDSEDETDDVYAFRYEENGDELLLFTIEDEEEWNLVEETFNTLLGELDGQK